jgi:hypothetical protein
MYVGVRAGYNINKIMLVFNTGAIPADAIILSAYIALFQTALWMTSDTLVVQNGQPTFPHNPVVVGDFDRTQYAGNGGSLPVGGGTVKYIYIPLNSTGLGWINKGGFTKLCVRTQNEIDGLSTPTNTKFEGPLGPGGIYTDPKLVVTYFVPGQNLQMVYAKDCGEYVHYTDADYDTARDAPAGTLESGIDYISIAQALLFGSYYIARGYLYFDTSAILVGSGIADVQLVFTGKENTTDTDFDITVQSGQPTYPTYPALVAADYDRTKYAGNYGTLGTAGFIVEGENRISLSTDFILNQLVCGGLTKICLRSSRDINADAPVMFTPEGVKIYSADPTVPAYKRPRLEITYIGGRVAEAPSLIDIGWKAAQRGF